MPIVILSGRTSGISMRACSVPELVSRSLPAMSKVVAVVLVLLIFKVMLPRRVRRSTTSITPYGSVFDVAVPTELACSMLCYAPGEKRPEHEHASSRR